MPCRSRQPHGTGPGLDLILRPLIGLGVVAAAWVGIGVVALVVGVVLAARFR